MRGSSGRNQPEQYKNESMQGLAAYIMRGPRQAALFATVATIIPLMFWLGAAAVALVVLRFGLVRGVSVAVWPMLPAMLWMYWAADPNALVVIPLAMLMAWVLRSTISWSKTYLAGGAVSLVLGVLAPSLMPATVQLLLDFAQEIYTAMQQSGAFVVEGTGAEVKAAFDMLVLASFAATLFGSSVGSVFLARSWQSRLYNPGGWQQEFHQMRLHPMSSVLLAVLFVLLPNFGVSAMFLLLVALTPMLVCGLALMHGIIAKKRMGTHWLVATYVIVLALMPMSLLLLALLAMLDSIADFRGRIHAA